MDDTKTNLLVISNSMIEALATNGAILANFGSCFSGFVRGKTTNCGQPKCGEGTRHAENDYAKVRNCIGGLPPAKKLLLKRLLNTNKIRLDVRRDESAKKVVLTF